jgi:starch synthase
MNILMITSECSPYAKTGGLADVVPALSKALIKAGHSVKIVMPKYAQINATHYGLNTELGSLGVWMGNSLEWCSVLGTQSNKLPVYFIESKKYYDRWGLYHDANFSDYPDNPLRFAFLARAALQYCIDSNYPVDIVHAHDWQAALAPAYLKIWHWNDALLGNAASLLTIHNIAYQGVYSAEHYNYLGLQWGNFTSDKFEDHGRVNFLKGGIQYADLVNTVSPTYANETRTPEIAFGLAPYLNNKGGNYLGILNGVDYEEWDPVHDPLIPVNFSKDDLAGKAACKAHLQNRFNLEIAPQIPIIACVSRLVAQKGLSMLATTLDAILDNMLVQFVVLGTGERDLEGYFSDLAGRYPGRVGTHIGYHNELAHWIEAGADFFVMPSLYEPCGLNQIYSLRYGTIPIVRATGGLDDTVNQYDESSGQGTGFKFWDATPSAVYYTIGWAVSTYFDRPDHIQRMIQAGMTMDFSWEASAREYEAAYLRALTNKRSLT